MKPLKSLRRVLIVASSEKILSFLSDVLDSKEFAPFLYVQNANEARRLLINNDFDLVIINAPLQDESGEDLALFVSERLNCGVMLLVKAEVFDAVCSKVEDFGVFTLAKPLSKQYFYHALKLVVAASNRMEIFRQENKRLNIKLEQMRVISRAKCALIEYLNMNEFQAHRYIEKQAMDMRITKLQVAEEILKSYDP